MRLTGSDAPPTRRRERDAFAIALALLATIVTACEQERRVPYIPPTLHNWERPYRGNAGLKLHAFRTGTLRVMEGLALGSGGKPRRREMPVLAWVLEHPRKGLIVIDAGLNRELAERRDGYLGGLLEMSVETELGADEHLSAQMLAAGLDPTRVRTVVLSNLRFHHSGDVEAFARARVVASKAEHRRALEKPAGYVLREFDDVENWEFVEVGRDGRPLGTLTAAIDLLGDGSLVLIDAPGPTPGNLAVLVRLGNRAVVLAGDLAPLPATFRHAGKPAFLADVDAWWDHIWRLKRFSELEPALLVVPGHSAESIEQAALPPVRLHDYEPPDATPKP